CPTFGHIDTRSAIIIGAMLRRARAKGICCAEGAWRVRGLTYLRGRPTLAAGRWATPSSLQHRHTMEKLLLLATNGLSWGLIIALIALGLAIIFGLLDIINLAHGDFFMVGTVLAWATLQSTGSFWLGFVAAPLIGFILGALIQRVVIQPIRNVAALSIVATFGVSLILQESVRITYGPTPGRILPPIHSTIHMFGIDYEVYRLFAATIAILALGGFFLFLQHTKLGTWMRAVR